MTVIRISLISSIVLCFLDFKALPQYTLAHARAVYKTAAVVQDTKTIVQELDINSLGELRGMQKPDVDIEDLMASIIMIRTYNRTLDL